MVGAIKGDTKSLDYGSYRFIRVWGWGCRV